MTATVPVPAKPTFWQRITFQKVPPQTTTMTFYVCCPRCAEAAQRDASKYLVQAMIDRAGR